MNGDLAFKIVDPLDDDARYAVAQYFDELNRRFDGGFNPTDAHLTDAPSLRPPEGAFVVAYFDGHVVGCGGLRKIPPTESDPAGTSVGEIKRMWVSPAARGRGVGTGLLAELEALAWAAGHTVIRLDTNEVLVEAIAMYHKAGFVAIAPYNTSPDPTHWFEKRRAS